MATTRAPATGGRRDAADPGDHGGALRRATSRRPRPLAYGETWSRGEVEVTLVPAGHVLGSAQVVVEVAGPDHGRHRGDYKRARRPDLRARSSRSAATSSSPRRPSACPCSAIRPLRRRSPGCCASVEQFPERCHLVGAYALGKAQRLIALLRVAGWDRPISAARRAARRLNALYGEFGVDLGPLRPATTGTSATSPARS